MVSEETEMLIEVSVLSNAKSRGSSRVFAW